jgi:transposase-like protein
VKRSSCAKGATVKVSKERRDHVSELLDIDVREFIRTGVNEYLSRALQFFAEMLMASEVQEKAGKRYARDTDKTCARWGSQDSSAFVLGQRMPIDKPRLRTADGKAEIPLETAEALTDPKTLDENAGKRLLIGVSTRRYVDTVDGLIQERGIGRQSISRKGAEYMAKKLEEFQARSLKQLDLVCIFVDGIHIDGTVHVVALGVDVQGKKHVLGMMPGETEDHIICCDLLANLIERGLTEVGGLLFVIDGGKGLRKAIRKFYGKRVAVQRCIIHKIRNLESHTPKHMHQELRHKFQAAFAMESLVDAETAFDQLRRELSIIRPSAEKSLLEGLAEVLTLHRLSVTGALRKSLCTTNSIESIFSTARFYSRNVKRWRGEKQAQRWLAAGLLEAETKLKPVNGYTRLKDLQKNLRKFIDD